MTPADRVVAWNASFAAVCDVTLDGKHYTTRAAAQVIADGRAVIWLYGREGAVDLDQVVPA